MDALAELLDRPRARGAFVLRSILSPPWSLRIEDREPLTLVAVIHGHAWILPDGGEPKRLEPGEAAILRGADAYTLADEPGRDVRVVIHRSRDVPISGPPHPPHPPPWKVRQTRPGTFDWRSPTGTTATTHPHNYLTGEESSPPRQTPRDRPAGRGQATVSGERS